MSISVIIPTYNRAEILRRTLAGYFAQSGDHQIIEVLVVDDGSKDHTAEVVKGCIGLSAMPLRYLHQENGGLSAARNHAIREAKGDLLLLGDDDIIPASDMVAEHVAWHRQFPEPEVGILGHVAWAEELHPTPFMKWSGLYGPQFNFGAFKRGMQLDFMHGYFCNTTVKKRFLDQHGIFDERFRTYGNEDVELSYRLIKKGYRLLYNPDAIGYHYKYETFENAVQRVGKLQEAWPIFSKTEAGEERLRLWSAENHRSRKPALKKILKPLKACVIPLLKPVCDTRIPLPIWLYNMVFYHYITPFATIVEAARRETRQDEAK